jgi:hypothetical protein
VLTGFGHAERTCPNSPLRSPHSDYDLGEYQAPERILGWKCDGAVDCWGFGILLYIILVGTVRPHWLKCTSGFKQLVPTQHPFGSAQEYRGPDDMQRRILNEPIRFSAAEGISPAGRDLVAKVILSYSTCSFVGTIDIPPVP